MKTLIVAGIIVAGLGSAAWIHAIAQNAPRAAAPLSAAEEASALQLINSTCATCHGQNAAGGDRAPSLVGSASLRKMDTAQIAAIITGGTPRGMPPFAGLPAAQIANIAAWIHSKNLTGAVEGTPEQVAAGERFFF
ncbi:MAG: cytochrome c, partial [Rhizobiales bacterium]|nr:cytochrome c [Hyphomicrobiales bacterium]